MGFADNRVRDENGFVVIRSLGVKYVADGKTKLEGLDRNQLDLSETVDKLESGFKHALDGIKAQILGVEESLRKETGNLRATNKELPPKITILEKVMANAGKVPILWIPNQNPLIMLGAECG